MFLGGALDEEPAMGSFKVTLDSSASCRALCSERTANSPTWSAPIPGNKYSTQVEKTTPPRPRPFDSLQMKKWQSTSQYVEYNSGSRIFSNSSSAEGGTCSS